MLTLATFIALYATATLFGAMVFFSAVIAPLVFTKLDGPIAGGFIRQLFPWYYLVIIILAALAALALLPNRPLDGAWMAGVVAAGIVSRQVLMPRINRVRDAVLAGEHARERTFSRLHRLSVWINIVQMGIVGVVLARFA